MFTTTTTTRMTMPLAMALKLEEDAHTPLPIGLVRGLGGELLLAKGASSAAMRSFGSARVEAGVRAVTGLRSATLKSQTAIDQARTQRLEAKRHAPTTTSATAVITTATAVSPPPAAAAAAVTEPPSLDELAALLERL
jgi:hypothetical protein